MSFMNKAQKKVPIIILTRGVYGRQFTGPCAASETCMSGMMLWALVRNCRLEYPKLQIRVIDMSPDICYADIADRILAHPDRGDAAFYPTEPRGAGRHPASRRDGKRC